LDTLFLDNDDFCLYDRLRVQSLDATCTWFGFNNFCGSLFDNFLNDFLNNFFEVFSLGVGRLPNVQSTGWDVA
jgi:hypothetical protein